LKTAVASQVDTFSAVLFSTLIKSALLDYGIDQPEKFLALVRGDIVTVRVTQDGDHALLIAQARNRGSLRELLSGTLGMTLVRDPGGPGEIFEDPKGSIAAGFIDEFVMIGSPADIRRYHQLLKAGGSASNDGQLRRIASFVPFTSSASIITYTDDSDRVRSFVAAAREAKGVAPVSPDQTAQMLSALPYAATETTLIDRGFQRVTKSPLGQFSALLPLVVPDKPTAQPPGANPSP
jgi:hypothetical protein